jgi:hypothetical protein
MSEPRTGSDPIVDGGCDGSSACKAETHIHGCYADAGNCDEPGEYHAAVVSEETL